MRRLHRRESEVLADTYGDGIWRQIDGILHTVSREVVKHAATVDDDVVVLKGLTYIRGDMDYGAYMSRRLHGWVFVKPHGQIT